MSELPKTFGPYMLLKLLAKGGMGEIYLARTQGISHFEKYYAIKKLLKKFAKDQDVGARFIDEAKLGARLQHPNIVQVFDLGALGEELYMATEFVDGFDLRRVLRFCHEKKKRIPLDIALFIVREVLSGLAYAHRQLDAEGQSINLIHRDISPQNVLVSFEGEVKIIDFGLAKSTQRSQETQANVLLGNFGYMSPEQARGQKLDVRTDIYSTGIVLFELVTRTKRFVDENPLRLLEMVARPTPVMPSDRAPDVPKKVDQIYSKATAPAKEDRYQTADEFRQDVTTALHKINPHASREHLAQFLNHLFLGGKPPPAPDNDALDKSVALQVHELYQQAEAFRRTKEQDAQDRRLSQFSDDAPQTGSHNLMRACRAGDTLTHTELTGEPPLVDAPPVPAASSPILQAVAEPVAEEAVLELEEAEVLPATESDRKLRWGEAVPPEVATATTSVYEAPEWAGRPTGQFDMPAGNLHTPSGEGSALERQSGRAAAPPPAAAAVAPPPRPPPAAAAPPPPPAPAPRPTVDPASRPPIAHVDPANRPPVVHADPASRPPDPSAFARGTAVVTTTVAGRGDVEIESEEPTVVVDMDSMAQPDSGAGRQDPMPAPNTNVFGRGGHHESLIIDFDRSDLGSQEEENLYYQDPDDPDDDEDVTARHSASPGGPPATRPPATGGEPAIRPAATPGDPSIRPAAQPAAQPGSRPKRRPVMDINPNSRKRR